MGISNGAADPGAGTIFWLLLIAFWVIVWILNRGSDGAAKRAEDAARPAEDAAQRASEVEDWRPD